MILPPNYERTRRRYPVLVLLDGALSDHTSWLTQTDLFAFTAGLPDEQQAIVVMPLGDRDGFWIDWHNGAVSPDRYTGDTLIPYIDANFRTLADRDHRAIAGLSSGGGGDASFAARHPDLVTAFASFSGVLGSSVATARMTGPAYAPARAAVLNAVNLATNACAGILDPLALCGDPVTDADWCAAFDPFAMLGNYANVSIDVYVGNGVPCDPEDVTTMASQDPTKTLEAGIRVADDDQHAALVRAGVVHRYHPYDCGIHSWRYWQRDLHDWWPLMVARFTA